MFLALTDELLSPIVSTLSTFLLLKLRIFISLSGEVDQQQIRSLLVCPLIQMSEIVLKTPFFELKISIFQSSLSFLE